MPYELTPADHIWNRAAMDGGGESPALGDIALTSLLYAHGYIMNGGVLYAIELLSPKELLDAQEGFCYFGLNDVASMLRSAKTIFEAEDNLEEHEFQLNDQYPDEALISQRFERRFRETPSDFSPL